MAAPQGIVTPEAVVLRFETAGVPSRALAKALDVAIAFVAIGFAALAISLADVDGAWAVVIVLVVSTLGFFAYPAVGEARWGTTVGKLALGLSVRTVEGGPARARHTTIRSALQAVDLLASTGMVGVFSTLASPLDQRLGDRVAGTIVLRQRTGVHPAQAVAFPPLPGYEGYVASLDVTAVTPAQYEVLRSFLTRVSTLTPEARWQLASRIAGPLSVAMGHALPPGLHPELFCACVASAYQQRHGGPQWAT